MKNRKILRKITQGMYVLTTGDGGCMVDAVSQISSSEYPLISIAVMKENNTNQLMQKEGKFALSILGKDVDPKIIEVFGYHSMRDMDKFAEVSTELVSDVPVIKDSLGYIVCEFVDSLENETHTLFIGRVVEANVFKDEEAMSYQYYQENKEDLLKVTTVKGKTAWICTVCGYVYYGEELPDDFRCPECGVGKKYFKLKGSKKNVKK